MKASDLMVKCLEQEGIEYIFGVPGEENADFLAAEIDEHYWPELELVGDLAHTLWMLNKRLQARTTPPSFDLKKQQQVRNALSADFAELRDDETRGSIKPQKVLWDVRQTMGAEDILLSDVGAHKMWIARYYHCYQPNTCLIPNGFCSMGFALPGAIAANLVYPQRRILAIAGDGGFMMNVQEMETAKRLNSNIVVMVWEDSCYGLIAWKQQDHFGRHTDLAFGNPNWLQLASAFGWHGYYIDESNNLKDALENAFQEQGPSLLVVPIDYRENALLTQKLGELTCQI